MRLPFLIASAMALAACTSHDAPTGGAAASVAPGLRAQGTTATPHGATRTIAALPDRGHFLDYVAGQPLRSSAYTLHPVALSEANALRSITTGTMELQAPDGTPIRLRYARHIEHKDGNWTWIGRPDGAQPGTEAIITFGEKAVFGSVPNGDKPALRITTARGRTWVIETDGRALARMGAAGKLPHGPDVLALPPALAGARDVALKRAASSPQKLTASGAVPESAIVDVVIGYTNGFAARLGGASPTQTRLTYLVDVANAAFANSQIVAQIRLVSSVQVNYPDDTDNEIALHQATGVIDACSPGNCPDAPVPAALQPLVNERLAKHADLMSLVRVFTYPANQSCGIAWLLGGSRSGTIAQDEAYAGVSVISDSSGDLLPSGGYFCRDETFIHELGHNMGSAHDRTTAAGDDGVLDDGDYGVFDYSFGYKNPSFYTIMAYRDSDAQTAYRVFSNPRIAYCGEACGTADNDNARSLGQAAPMVSAFYPSVSRSAMRDDFDGSGRSDVMWRNTTNGTNYLWRGASAASTQQLVTVTDQAWKVVGTGDFDADGFADLLWRNTRTGANTIWRSGNGNTALAMTTVPSQAWVVSGVGDFDGDGHSDILWHNTNTGQSIIWRSGNGTSAQTLTTANVVWKIVGVGDVNADGSADILWRNSTTGANTIWRSGNAATPQSMLTVAAQAWTVVGVGDFDNDGTSDILWRNTSTGANLVWRAGNGATTIAVATVADQNWKVARVADYNGDGRADVLWRHATSGANAIWLSANSATTQAITAAATVYVVGGG